MQTGVDNPTRARRPWCYWVLAALPLIFLVIFVWRYRVDVPYWDDWDMAPMLEKYHQGDLTLGYLWRVRSGVHKVFFPNALNLLLAVWSGWQVSYELAAQISVAVASFCILVWQVRRTLREVRQDYRTWILPVISLMMFSMSQRAGWLHGFHVQWFLNPCFVTLGIVILCGRPFSWGRFWGAAVCGTVAMYSYSNALAFWLIGFWILYLCAGDARTRAVTLWAVVSVIVIVGGIYDFTPSDFRLHSDEPMAQSGVGLAINGVLYMLINLGAPIVPYSRKGAFVLGIIGLAGSIWMVWRLLKHHGFQARQLAPYLALQAYALCSAAMNAAGRVGYGTYFALNSRYIIMTTLFWVPAAVFAYLLARTNCAAPLLITRPGLRRTLVNAGAWLMLSLLLLGSAQGCLTWLRWRPELIEAQNEMLLGQEGEAWAKLFPYKEVLRQRADVIKRYRLSIFRQTAQ